MKERLGLILAAAGVILLMEPKVDLKVMYEQSGAFLFHYWPVGLILLGAVLINPKKKKKKSAR